MAASKKTSRKRTGGSRSATRKSAARKKTSKKKTTAKKTTKKAAAKKKTTAKKTTRKKTAAKKTTKKKATAKKTTRKKTAAKKKATAKKPTKKTAAKKKSPAKRSTKKTAAKKTATAPPATPIKLNRPPKPKARRTRPAKLDKATLKGIRKQLEDERAELVRQQDELEQESFEATQTETSGEMGTDQDFADAGTATFDRERDLSIRNNIQDLVDQMTRAIGSIEAGTYGTCERCGRPIDAARLKALPHALLCMDCKRREERAR